MHLLIVGCSGRLSVRIIIAAAEKKKKNNERRSERSTTLPHLVRGVDGARGRLSGFGAASLPIVA